METRRNTNRISQHNYSTPGYYFITILTYNRQNILGKIKNKRMIFNEYGSIADKICQEISTHFPDTELDEYIIMPNHIHIIINIVRAADLPPLQNNNRTKMTLSKIVHGVKSTITRKINKIYKSQNPIWQRNYHDHIIRNANALNRIRQYIQNNPSTWENDIENPNRIRNIESELLL